METALVAVRDTDEYKQLLDRSWDYIADIRAQGYELTVLRWRWGYELAGIETKYGDSFIDSLAEDVHWNRSTLYDYRALGKLFDSEEELTDYWDKCVANGIQMSLSRLLRGALPDPTQRPENYGGKAQVVDDLMRQVETLAIKKEKLREFLNAPELDLGKKQEIMGVLKKVEEVETREISSGTTIGRSEDYLDYIRSLPCCECDFHPTVPHHVETGGVGMKGSDFSTIPLCRKHHDEGHNNGWETFQETYNIRLDTEINRVLIEWCDMREADNV